MKLVQPITVTSRDDGPPLFWLRAMAQIEGIDYRRVPLEGPIESWGEFDFALYIDFGQDCLRLPDGPFPERSVCVLSDTHPSPEAFLYRYTQAGKCLAACVNQIDARQQFGHLGLKQVYWMPHAVDHTIYTPLLRDYSINRAAYPPDPDAPEWKALVVRAVPRVDLSWAGFIGDARRRQALDIMFKAFPDFDCRIGDTWFEEAAKAYGYSRIGFNISIKSEMNMRTFEILATRTFLLTDRQMGMKETGLIDGEHCAIYDTIPEAIEKASFYLKHDALREKIAEAGYRWVLAHHTHWHRARTMVDLLKKLPVE